MGKAALLWRRARRSREQPPAALRGRRRGAPLRAACLWLCLLLAGAAPAQARPQDPDQGIDQALEALRALDLRAARVAFALRQANRDRCPRTALLFGWTLHNAAQYSPRVRPRAQRLFALVQDHPALLVVVPGGPAEAAGLRPDDTLMAANGVGLGEGRLAAAASFASLAASSDRLQAELSRSGRLQVRRNGETIERTISPRPGCAYETQVDPSSEVRASADANRVFVTSAMIEFTRDDDELAVVLGHEYAHIILGHPPDPLAPEPPSRRRALSPRTAEQELAADRLGLQLAHRAGFDVAAAPRLLERLGRTRPWLHFLPSGHPLLGRRIRSVRQEIERLRGEA